MSEEKKEMFKNVKALPGLKAELDKLMERVREKKRDIHALSSSVVARRNEKLEELRRAEEEAEAERLKAQIADSAQREWIVRRTM